MARQFPIYSFRLQITDMTSIWIPDFAKVMEFRRELVIECGQGSIYARITPENYDWIIAKLLEAQEH